MLKKKDMILMMSVCLLAGVMAFLLYVGQGKNGEMVRVMIDGKEYGVYTMDENRVIEVENEQGYNRLVIENGEVFMQEADCPDQYCVEHRSITKANETIVCLPHKLVVELLVPMEEDGIDSVTQ